MVVSKPSLKNIATDFDDLLGVPPTVEEKAAAVEVTSPEGADTPEQIRIRELEAQIAAFAAVPVEKSETVKNLEHTLALRANSAALSAHETLEEVIEDDPNVIMIHVLDTGISFADRVWNYGQSVGFKRGGKAYQDTVDRNGVSWLDDLSAKAQYARFGKIVIGVGPYYGPAFNDEIERLDEKRKLAAPVINII